MEVAVFHRISKALHGNRYFIERIARYFIDPPFFGLI